MIVNFCKFLNLLNFYFFFIYYIGWEEKCWWANPSKASGCKRNVELLKNEIKPDLAIEQLTKNAKRNCVLQFPGDCCFRGERKVCVRDVTETLEENTIMKRNCVLQFPGDCCFRGERKVCVRDVTETLEEKALFKRTCVIQFPGDCCFRGERKVCY